MTVEMRRIRTQTASGPRGRDEYGIVQAKPPPAPLPSSCEPKVGRGDVALCGRHATCWPCEVGTRRCDGCPEIVPADKERCPTCAVALLCRHCWNRPRSSARSRYCGQRCRRRAHNRRKRKRRRDALKGIDEQRLCSCCLGEIPTSRRTDARYCSPRCQRLAAWRRRSASLVELAGLPLAAARSVELDECVAELGAERPADPSSASSRSTPLSVLSATRVADTPRRSGIG